MAGSIADASAAPQADRTVEVCIIGSGCGGATAAWELAQAGKEVLVLEEGADYTGARLTQRDGAMYDQLYMDHGGRMTSDRSIAILQGWVVCTAPATSPCSIRQDSPPAPQATPWRPSWRSPVFSRRSCSLTGRRTGSQVLSPGAPSC